MIRSLWRQRFSGFLLVLLVLAGTSRLPAQVAATSLPAESTETQAKRLLEVINSGNPDTAREFARAHFSERTLQETSVDDLVALLGKMKLQSGGLDVVRVLPPEMPDQANLLLRTRRDDHFLRLIVFSRDG